MRNTASALLAAALLGTISFWPETAAEVVHFENGAFELAPQDTTKAKKKGNSVHIVTDNENGKHNYVNISNGRNETLTYKGTITLTDDFTSIKSISPKGYLKYSLSEDGDEQELEITSDAQGKLTRKYSVDGKEVAFVPAGEQWLQKIMPDLIAKSGIGLEARVKDLYQQQGAKGVIAEAEKVEGEHSQLRLISYLLQQPNLKSNDVALALEHAGKLSSSDYELSKLLRNVPAASLADRGIANAYLQATANISSDYEKAKTLAYLIKVPKLDKQASDHALKVIGSVSSDYEKSKLIQQFSADETLLKNSCAGTIGLINSLSSDYEKNKSIQSILSQHALSAAQYQELLPVVRGISSDYEKGKILRALASRIPANATALREEYKSVAKTISSDYEYRKAMEALN